MANILVTGAAGFIGYHVCDRLLRRGDTVAGIDNLNPYYDVRLKQARLSRLCNTKKFHFLQMDVADRAAMSALFAEQRPERVVHLAAQAGVRYSLENPAAYIDSNLVGFGNILEGARHGGVQHLVYASSSSVYGNNTTMPFSEHHGVNHPISLYAATKKANELMAHTYSHLFALPTTGLRFFTVYGPWGRPDMAMMLFARAILRGEPIRMFNHGKMRRDFTYIDDIVESIVRVLDLPAQSDPQWSREHPDPATSSAPYRVYNIGNSSPVDLPVVIEELERNLGRRAVIEMADMQPGDVPATFADTSELERAVDFRPSISVAEGIARTVRWYTSYYAADGSPIA